MIRHTAPSSWKLQTVAVLLALMLCGLIPVTHATPLAKISILSVTPRSVALSGNPAFDQVSTGFNNTAIDHRL